MKTLILLLSLVIIDYGISIRSNGFEVHQKPDNTDCLYSEVLCSVQKETTPAISAIDSTELIRFWNSIVIPILTKNKEKVMSDMEFPVLGDWTKMLELKIQAQNANAADFEKVYHRFFNNNFLDALAKQSYKDIRMYHEGNDIWYTFGVVRRVGKDPEIGESGVYLMYIYHNKTFKLKKIMGAGGNFYYQDK